MVTTPGPANLILMLSGAKFGFYKSIPFVIGVTFGKLFLTLGLGLGLFIGKTLLEKNFASVNCWNSKKKSGAEVTITWKNKDLFKI